MSEALKQKLISKLELVSSKKIVLVEKTDESILGGIVLSYGNTQIDATRITSYNVCYTKLLRILTPSLCYN